MAKDIQGVGLGLATRFSGSRIAAKTGLREPAERLAYLSTKAGFRFAGNLLKKKPRPQQPENGERLPNSREKNLFDLTLTEDQQIIRDTMHAYAEKVLRISADFADDALCPPPNFHGQAQALGLSHLSVAESFGGVAQEYCPTTSCIIAEHLAWGDFSLAVAMLAPAAAASAVSRWGTQHQQQRLLPLWLQDEPLKAAIAVQEAGILFNPMQLSSCAKTNSDGYRLSGSKTLVPLGGEANLYLVAAMLDEKPRIFIVPAKARGVRFEAHGAMGLKAAATGNLSFNNVQLDSSALLGGDDFNYQEFIDLGQLHWCALAIGTCQAALDYLIPYCNERKAFGEAISSRQSVAFMLADIATELEAMRLMTWRAAALAEQGKAFHREAALAHILCSEKAMKIGTDAIQLMGGHGFTKEHPVERWYRDLRVLSCITSGLHL